MTRFIIDLEKKKKKKKCLETKPKNVLNARDTQSACWKKRKEGKFAFSFLFSFFDRLYYSRMDNRLQKRIKK